MEEKLRIRQISLYKFDIPLIEPFTTSLGTDTSARNLLVKITTESGIRGFGECSPYMPINGESVDTCAVVGKYFATALTGANTLDIPGCIEKMDRIIYGNSSIKSAFDIALYDINAQFRVLPLYAFLGGKNEKQITTDYTVSIGEPDQMAIEAKKILDQGYPAIKVKLGKHGPTDVKRIQKIREAVGMEVPLRIDANQGWSLPEAIETLKALSSFDIQHCEEPIPRWQFLDLALVNRESPIPIMADESCSDEHDAERLIRLKACDYFNIKLGKSGGIYKALKMVKMAEEAGIHLQVGAFLESRLAMTAFAHFSLCSNAIQHFDFDTALMFSEDPVSGGIRYQENGKVEVPDLPGLGAFIDETILKKMEQVA